MAASKAERQDMIKKSHAKYRPRKVILKGRYYRPIVPELGHYENEGTWGYDKLIHIEKNKYKVVSCLFDSEQKRDEAYDEEVKRIMDFGKILLTKRTSVNKKELDDLELELVDSSPADKVIEGKVIRLIV